MHGPGIERLLLLVQVATGDVWTRRSRAANLSLAGRLEDDEYGVQVRWQRRRAWRRDPGGCPSRPHWRIRKLAG